MPDDSKQLKSAYELAMERLRAEDEKKGVEHKALSAEQKDRIRLAREEAKAKLAEFEILYRDKRAAAQSDPERVAELEQMDEHYGIDRRRIESSLESEIERIKKG